MQEEHPASGFEGAPGEELAPVELEPRAEGPLRERIRSFFWPLFADMGGIDSWLVSESAREDTPDLVFERLDRLNREPLSHAQFDQLLILSHEAGMSSGFFKYYWLSCHPTVYEPRKVASFDAAWLSKASIASLEHLRWGLYRFYTDALFFFGSIRSAYRALRESSEDEIREFFLSKRVDTEALGRRGPALPLKHIAQDDRYLIAEKACKSLEGGANAEAVKAIEEAYKRHIETGGLPVVSVGQLIDQVERGPQQEQFEFIFGDERETVLSSNDDLRQLAERKEQKFNSSRSAALENTRLYLSMVEELDVYVATSMRTRDDFRQMAGFCKEIFEDHGLKQLEVRYFDPTMSAAQGHIDKGLIECLMVKTAKVLVYYAGRSETLGKDAEFTMALSQGKPVIIYCENEDRRRLYRDIHPLTRLIDFNTGVSVGAMVTDSRDEVKQLLNRIFRNEMEYEIKQTKPGYIVLSEGLTDSVVRLQTNDRMLHETFWNYYHRKSSTQTHDARGIQWRSAT